MYKKLEKETKLLFCNNIIRLRSKRDWTQEKFAEYMGYSRTYVAKTESKKHISLNYIIRATDVFKLTFDEILNS